MKQITTDQSHQIIATLVTNTDWSQIDFADSKLQDTLIRNPQEVGAQFTTFLKNGGRIALNEPRIIKIDRTKQFDPRYYLRKDEKDFVIGEEDERSLTLTEIDISKIHFKDAGFPSWEHKNGEERMSRIKKTSYIRLDAQVFHVLVDMLRKDRYLIHERYAEDDCGRPSRIHFDGTILLKEGRRYVPYLMRYPHRSRFSKFDGWEWGHGFHDLSLRHEPNQDGPELSAVLED